MARPKVAMLSRELIADTAIDLVDKNGKFTMTELARRLKVSPPSLYNHVSGADGVVELMRERIHLEQGPDIDPSWAWQDVIRHVAAHDRASIGRHPWLVADLMISVVTAGEPLESVVSFATVLRDAGFTAEQVYLIIGAVDLLTAGGALDLNAPERIYDVDVELGDNALGEALRANPGGVARADAVFNFAVDQLVHSLETTLAERA